MGNLTSLEEKVLKKIAENHIAAKTDLKNFLRENGFKNTESSDIKNIVNSVTQSLVSKRLIRCINPIGSPLFVVTKEGNRAVENIK